MQICLQTVKKRKKYTTITKKQFYNNKIGKKIQRLQNKIDTVEFCITKVMFV